ncbi:MAG: hypothetical protein PF495_14500, partial [Spirochaetales bacterium]|nr:hypothetical protein [Spirochaetales bacterium]
HIMDSFNNFLVELCIELINPFGNLVVSLLLSQWEVIIGATMATILDAEGSLAIDVKGGSEAARVFTGEGHILDVFLVQICTCSLDYSP